MTCHTSGLVCLFTGPQIRTSCEASGSVSRHAASRRFAGFNRLHESGQIAEAACWAHVRRKFHDLYEAHVSPIAKEALERIAALYAIEKEIRGRPPDQRLNGINPEAYLSHVLLRIADHPINRIEELLPWNVSVSRSTDATEITL